MDPNLYSSAVHVDIHTFVSSYCAECVLPLGIGFIRVNYFGRWNESKRFKRPKCACHSAITMKTHTAQLVYWPPNWETHRTHLGPTLWTRVQLRQDEVSQCPGDIQMGKQE